MALFTDGTVSGIEDLAAQDTQVLDLARLEGLDLTRTLALAQEEIGMELAALRPRLGGADQLWGFPGISAGSVVVTSPLKHWHVYRTLEMVYRDAYNSQLNDRYLGKRNQYRELAKWAFEKVLQLGVGIATDPLPQPSPPTVTLVAGTLPDGTYFVTGGWVNRGGEEGASAVPADVCVSEATFQARLQGAPKNAVGWNVYAGASPDRMVRQNETPIPTTEAWTQPGTLTLSGHLAGTGQEPSYIRAVPRTIQRG